MTVAELRAKMTTRELAEQMIFDKLKKEAAQEARLDRLLESTQRAALAKRRG